MTNSQSTNQSKRKSNKAHEPIVQSKRSTDKSTLKAEKPRAQWPTLLGILAVVAVITIVPFLVLKPREERYVLRSYSLAKAEQGTVVEQVTAVGTLASGDVRQVYVPVAGTVESVEVAEGDDVKDGAVLARLTAPELEEAINKAKRTLEEVREDQSMNVGKAIIDRDQARYDFQQAKANIQLARRELSAAEALFKIGGQSQSEVEKARQTLNDVQIKIQAAQRKLSVTEQQLQFTKSSTQRKLDAAQAELKRAEEKKKNLAVRSPLAGRISAIKLKVGQSAIAGAEFTTVSSLSKMQVELGLSEELARRVKVGQEATIRFGEQDFQATVNRISSNTVAGNEQKAPTVPVFLKFNKLPNKLRMGASADVELTLSTKSGVLTLPRGPYLTTGGERMAYVKTDSKQAERRDVGFGILGEDKVEVTSGLSEGEEIVTSSYEAYKDQKMIELSPTGKEEAK